MERRHHVRYSAHNHNPQPIDVYHPPRLTGLLSFMLSDEMTTGSVNTADADKRAYAARSHAWNIQQRKFKDAFPDVRNHPYNTCIQT